MAWTPVTTIAPISNWLFTEPVEGSFFQLKHSSFPRDGSYEIAQAEVGADGTIQLFDIQELKPSLELQTIEFKKPGVFGSRRIAVRRVARQPTFESELRRVIRDNLLRDPEESLFPPRRVSWQIAIEVSDYVEPASETASNSPTTSTKELIYATNGDTNGVCYWIGTNYGQSAWSNPHLSGRVTCQMSSIDQGAPENLVDRAGGKVNQTKNIPNSWDFIDLGKGNQLIPKHYTLQNRGMHLEHVIRNWKLQGSNNVASNTIADIESATWVDLDVRINDTTMADAPDAWGNYQVSNIITGYRWLRILQNGLTSHGTNYLLVSEFDGTFTRTI